MAHRYCQSVRSVIEFRLDVYLQCFLYNHCNLLLGGRAIAADGNLGLARSVLRHRDAAAGGGHNGRALRASQLEYDLRVLCIERRLDGHIVGMILIAQGSHLGADGGKLGIGVLLLAKVDDAHIQELRLPGPIYRNDPETQYVGSGIYS